MSKDDYFCNKKTWSKIKDELLNYYLSLYFPKVLITWFPVVYVDCFAGKGKFDNGEDGSPLIAIKAAKVAEDNSRIQESSIKLVFIEKKYSKELLKNTEEYRREVIEGNYEDNIIEILEDKQNCNVFLYIDPFGIKSLHFDIFKN